MPNWSLDNTCKRRSKLEKVSINIKFCIFRLVYSWVPNRRKVGINGGGGGEMENWKFDSRGGVKGISFDMLK